MKTAIFVPAKGTSERIRNKNIQILDGEYLFKRKLLQVLNCSEVDEVWLDSESDLFHNITSDLNIKHLHRDKDLASNSVDGHEIFYNQTRHTDADIVVQVLCTAPFIDETVIDNALRLLKNSSASSLVGVYKDKFYEWKEGKPSYGEKIPNSIDLPEIVLEAMSLYAVKTNKNPYPKRYTDNVILYDLTPKQRIDVNNPEDLELARDICAGERLKKVQQFKILSKNISSCLLSDICKEHGYSHYLSKNIKQLSSGNFLGFAKTLKIQALKKEKDWEGIFDALKSYSFVEAGDVIVVSTEVPEKAYFGDLNATFAVRQGAVGVVVDGMTRDIERVQKLDLPVYAHGTSADDVRYEGTFETMNMPININGVTVKNNDIIFADGDGVICIEQKNWNFVLSEIKKSLNKEMQVKLEATFGADPFEVLNTVGTF